MRPHAGSNFVILPGPHSSGSKYHVVFITGNPGLVEYYHSFLTLLHGKLNESTTTSSFSVYSTSLPNFSQDFGKLYSLQDVIEFVEDDLYAYAADVAPSPVRVVLMGHSVGAYIGLEILKHWQEGMKANNTRARSISINGYVGLWPTVTWISRSKNGRIASPLLNIPGYVRVAATIARILVLLLPSPALLLIIGFITSFPATASRTTRDFLKSQRGIHQALYMARDEMNEIQEDRWTDEVWTTSTDNSLSPRMAFHFGAKDHWVADETREELIKSRAATKGDTTKPLMEIDEHNIPHAFCISKLVSFGRKRRFNVSMNRRVIPNNNGIATILGMPLSTSPDPDLAGSVSQAVCHSSQLRMSHRPFRVSSNDEISYQSLHDMLMAMFCDNC